MTTIDSVASDPTDTLRAWAEGIRAHRPDDVAAVFTEDAIFQGFDPTHTVGRPGIAAYYDKQPIGLTADLDILDQRALADDAVLVYAHVDFAPPAAPVIPVHLTVVLRSIAGEWLISHYHVSKILPPAQPAAPAEPAAR